MDITVDVESVLNPTEDEAKVERALHNIFPREKVQKVNLGADVVVLRTHGNGLEFLSTLRILIKQERIRSAARSILFKGTTGQRIQVYLNKQAAFMGRPSFCATIGESPNGPIAIVIDSADPQAVIDYLASNRGEGFSRYDAERRRR